MIGRHSESNGSDGPPTMRLADRLGELGLTRVRLDADGGAELYLPAGPIEAAIIATPTFRKALRHAWGGLVAPRHESYGLWPGLMLLVLPPPRHRSSFGRAAVPARLDAAIILTRDLAHDPHFQAAAREAGYEPGQLLTLATDPGTSIADTAAVAPIPHPSTSDGRAMQAGFVPLSQLWSRAEIQRLDAMLGWMQRDCAEIDRRCHEVRSVSEQLLESYEELSLLYKFSARMTVDQPRARFLAETAGELQQVLGLRWLTLQLSGDEPRLGDLCGFAHTAGQPDCSEQVMKAIGRNLLQRHVATTGPELIESAMLDGLDALQRLTRQVLAVSIRVGERTVGLIFAGDKADGSPMSNLDATLCASLASSMSIFVENVMLYEDVQATFMGTLHALTASIDAKDSYTHGHSERVAMLARDLARAAGMDEKTVERIYIAGLVHDVGKIGVPEAVLTKAGPLTSHEFDLIKLHPEIGARILQDIPQMRDLVPAVLYHHERWDGRGYPHGLRGEDIPLYGRMLCLADSFDAMSSTRAYRGSMHSDAVLEEVRKCSGSQFDPDLARSFLTLDFTDYHKALKSKQLTPPLRQTA